MVNHKNIWVDNVNESSVPTWYTMKWVVIEKLLTVLNFFVINHEYINVDWCSYVVNCIVKSIRYKKSVFIIDSGWKVFVLKAIGGLGVFDLHSRQFGKIDPFFYKYVSRELADCQKNWWLRHIHVPFHISLKPIHYSKWCYTIDRSNPLPENKSFLEIWWSDTDHHVLLNREKRCLTDYTSPIPNSRYWEYFLSYDSQLTWVLCDRLRWIYNNYIRNWISLKNI